MRDSRAPHFIEFASTIPLWGITRDGVCACNQPDCLANPRNAGKHQRPYLRQIDPFAGYGIQTGAAGPNGSGVFVVDCDVKSVGGVTIDGLENFRAWCASNSIDLPHTLIVATGGGGFHFFFRCPIWTVRSSTSKFLPCVDIKGDRGYVVGPGSPHLSGVPYRIVHNAPVVEAPGALLDWLINYRPDPERVPIGALPPVDLESADGKRWLQMFRGECLGETPGLEIAYQGGVGDLKNMPGHSRLLIAAHRGAIYYRLPPETVVDILLFDYGPRCIPPFTNRAEIAHKVAEVIAKNDDFSFGPPPERFFEDLVKAAILGGQAPLIASDTYKYSVGESIAIGALLRKGTSEIAYTLHNSKDWRGVLSYDELFDVVRAKAPPIRLQCESLRAESPGFTDRDETAMKVYFESACQASVSTDQVFKIVDSVARIDSFHPVKRYFDTLPPPELKADGEPSIFDDLATRLFGDHEPLAQELLRRFCIAAVRRVLEPGCQVDTMLILYGKQGKGKSRIIRELFGVDWVNAQMPSLDKESEASMRLASCWVNDFGELNAMLRVSLEVSKDFITRPVDRYRRPYGRGLTIKPRQCVFVGSTDNEEYLSDPAGARRFWPIICGRMAKPAEVRKLRNEIWSAAVMLAKRDESQERHYIDEELDPVWYDLLIHRWGHHYDDEGWTDAIVEFCEGKEDVLTNDVYRFAVMQDDPKWLQTYSRTNKIRVKNVLRACGFRQGQRRIDGKVRKVMLCPDEIRRAVPGAAEIRRRAQREGHGATFALPTSVPTLPRAN